MINYSFVRCRFCKEFLYGGEYPDGLVDDVCHGICGRCWKEINYTFKIAGFTKEEIERASSQQE